VILSSDLLEDLCCD